MAVLKMKQNYVYDLDEGFEDFLSNRKVDKDVSEDTIKSYKDTGGNLIYGTVVVMTFTFYNH